MTDSQPSFSIGIEEEYLLVDSDSGDLAVDPPAGPMADPAVVDHLVGETVADCGGAVRRAKTAAHPAARPRASL
jgi:hypothetical protein